MIWVDSYGPLGWVSEFARRLGFRHPSLGSDFLRPLNLLLLAVRQCLKELMLRAADVGFVEMNTEVLYLAKDKY